MRKTKIKRSLIAGVGTGKAVLAHLEHFRPEEIVAVDLSKRSLQVAKRQLLALGIKHVTLLQCDLTTLPGHFHVQFDVIESVGVLHHLPDPKVGLASLKRMLAPDGVLVLGLYSRFARRSIPVMRQLARETAPEKFRDWLVQGGELSGRSLNHEEEQYKNEFLLEFSLGSRSNFEDLLFHPVEHVFELPEVETLLLTAGLHFTGVRVPTGSHGVADRWAPFFAPERKHMSGWPQMPLLAFLHRLETEMEPLLFTNMYVFTASHGPHSHKSAILPGASRWVGEDTPEPEALPLPFEEEWPRSLLQRAVVTYCSRVLHFVNGTTSSWTAPAPVDAWLEAKVAFGTHAARVAGALQTIDAALEYCSLLKSHFRAAWQNLFLHYTLKAFVRNGDVLNSQLPRPNSYAIQEFLPNTSYE